MPVHCAVAIEPLSTDDFRELDYKVMRHAFNSHNDLGRLADERIYQADLAKRLEDSGFAVHRELEVRLAFREYCKAFYLDFVVAERGVYELKVANAISDAHVGQLLTYLLLLDLPRGKLLNFGNSKVESRFVNAPFRSEQRRDFSLDDCDYRGSDAFRKLAIELLRDWGTSLSIPIYDEALISLLGGREKVEVMLPLCRDVTHLGNQRFHLASEHSAYQITTISRGKSAFEKQLSRLINYSPLREIHWINVEHELVSLKTVTR